MSNLNPEASEFKPKGDLNPSANEFVPKAFIKSDADVINQGSYLEIKDLIQEVHHKDTSPEDKSENSNRAIYPNWNIQYDKNSVEANLQVLKDLKTSFKYTLYLIQNEKDNPKRFQKLYLSLEKCLDNPVAFAWLGKNMFVYNSIGKFTITNQHQNIIPNPNANNNFDSDIKSSFTYITINLLLQSKERDISCKELVKFIAYIGQGLGINRGCFFLWFFNILKELSEHDIQKSKFIDQQILNNSTNPKQLLINCRLTFLSILKEFFNAGLFYSTFKFYSKQEINSKLDFYSFVSKDFDNFMFPFIQDICIILGKDNITFEEVYNLSILIEMVISRFEYDGDKLIKVLIPAFLSLRLKEEYYFERKFNILINIILTKVFKNNVKDSTLIIKAMELFLNKINMPFFLNIIDPATLSFITRCGYQMKLFSHFLAIVIKEFNIESHNKQNGDASSKTSYLIEILEKVFMTTIPHVFEKLNIIITQLNQTEKNEIILNIFKHFISIESKLIDLIIEVNPTIQYQQMREVVLPCHLRQLNLLKGNISEFEPNKWIIKLELILSKMNYIDQCNTFEEFIKPNNSILELRLLGNQNGILLKYVAQFYTNLLSNLKDQKQSNLELNEFITSLTFKLIPSIHDIFNNILIGLCYLLDFEEVYKVSDNFKVVDEPLILNNFIGQTISPILPLAVQEQFHILNIITNNNPKDQTININESINQQLNTILIKMKQNYNGKSKEWCLQLMLFNLNLLCDLSHTFDLFLNRSLSFFILIINNIFDTFPNTKIDNTTKLVNNNEMEYDSEILFYVPLIENLYLNIFDMFNFIFKEVDNNKNQTIINSLCLGYVDICINSLLFKIDLKFSKFIINLITQFISISDSSPLLILNKTQMIPKILIVFSNINSIETRLSLAKLLLKFIQIPLNCIYFQYELNQNDQLQSILKTNLKDNNEMIRKVYWKIHFKLLPMNFNTIKVQQSKDILDNNYLIIKNLVRSSPHSSLFYPYHFQFVIEQLNLSQYLISKTNNINSIDNWKHQILLDCCNIKSIKKEYPNLLDLNYDGLNNWIAWEVARYCILTRLRTPFGNPTQTLNAFEESINLLLNNNNNDNNNQQNSILLLKVIQYLQIWIYHCLYGHYNFNDNFKYVTSIVEPPKSSIIFFNVNKNVCLNWFTKNYFSLFKLSAKIEDKYSSFKYGWQVLNHLSKSKKDKKEMDSESELYNGLHVIINLILLFNGNQNQYYHLLSFKSWIEDFIKELKDFKYNIQSLIDIILKFINCFCEQNEPDFYFKVNQLFNILSEYKKECKHNSEIKFMEYVLDWIYNITNILDINTLNINEEPFNEYEDVFNQLNNKFEENDYNKLYNSFNLDELSSFKFIEDNFNSGLINSKYQLINKVKYWIFNTKDLSYDVDFINDNISNNLAKFHFIEDKQVEIIQLIQLGFNNNDCDVFNNVLNSLIKLFNQKQSILNSTNNVMESILFEKEFNSINYNLDELNVWDLIFKVFLKGYQNNLININNDQFILDSLFYIKGKCNNFIYKNYLNKLYTIVPKDKLDVLKLDYIFNSNNNINIIDDIQFNENNNNLVFNLVYKYNQKLLKSMEQSNEKLLVKIINKMDIINQIKLQPNNPQYYPIYANNINNNKLNQLCIQHFELNNINNQYSYEIADYYYNQLNSLNNNLKYGLSNTLMNYFGADLNMLNVFKQEDNQLNADEVFYNNIVLPLFNNNYEIQFISKVDSVNQPFKAFQNELKIHINQLINLCLKHYFNYFSTNNNIKDDKSISAALKILNILKKYNNYIESSICDDLGKLGNHKVFSLIMDQLIFNLNNENINNIIESIIINNFKYDFNSQNIYMLILKYNNKGNNKHLNNTIQRILLTSLNFDTTHIDNLFNFMQSLSKLTSLWDELWINKLNQFKIEFNNKIKKVGIEMEYIENELNIKLNFNQQLQIYHLYLQSLIKDVNNLMNKTFNLSPTNNYEMNLINKYFNKIKQAIVTLQNPKQNQLNNAFNELELIQKYMHVEMNNKNNQISLNLMSPYLKHLNHHQLYLPNHNQIIMKLDDTIKLLPTKTKPKKIQFIAKDGKSYFYLLKGYEDVNMDRLVMQYFRVNKLLFNNINNDSIQCFTILPFNNNGGIIEWVNQTIPLNSIYKHYLNRSYKNQQLVEQANNSLHNNNINNNNNEENSSIKNWNNLFWDQAQLILKQHKLNVNLPRKQWPMNINKKIYDKLIQKTNNNMFALEIQAYCFNNEEYYNKLKQLTISIALNSMLGYSIGLGDRHLDNILFDFNKAQFINIDFNIAFNRGKLLPTPELIPFRLSNNFNNIIQNYLPLFTHVSQISLLCLAQHYNIYELLFDMVQVDDWLIESPNYLMRIEKRKQIIIEYNKLNIRIQIILNSLKNIILNIINLFIKLKDYIVELSISFIDKYKRVLIHFIKVNLLPALNDALFINLKESINEVKDICNNDNKLNILNNLLYTIKDIKSIFLPKLIQLINDGMKPNHFVESNIENINDFINHFNSILINLNHFKLNDLNLNLEQINSPNFNTLANTCIDQYKALNKISVKDKVTQLIDDATNPDLLSKMFEGWTSWV